jgi:hypothetical protein
MVSLTVVLESLANSLLKAHLLRSRLVRVPSGRRLIVLHNNVCGHFFHFVFQNHYSVSKRVSVQGCVIPDNSERLCTLKSGSLRMISLILQRHAVSEPH